MCYYYKGKELQSLKKSRSILVFKSQSLANKIKKEPYSVV